MHSLANTRTAYKMVAIYICLTFLVNMVSFSIGMSLPINRSTPPQSPMSITSSPSFTLTDSNEINKFPKRLLITKLISTTRSSLDNNNLHHQLTDTSVLSHQHNVLRRSKRRIRNRRNLNNEHLETSTARSFGQPIIAQARKQSAKNANKSAATSAPPPQTPDIEGEEKPYWRNYNSHGTKGSSLQVELMAIVAFTMMFFLWRRINLLLTKKKKYFVPTKFVQTFILTLSPLSQLRMFPSICLSCQNEFTGSAWPISNVFHF